MSLYYYFQDRLDRKYTDLYCTIDNLRITAFDNDESKLPESLYNYRHKYSLLSDNTCKLNRIFHALAYSTYADYLLPILIGLFPNIKRIANYEAILDEQNTLYVSDLSYTNRLPNTDTIQNYVNNLLNRNCIIKQFRSMGISTYSQLLERYGNTSNIVIYFGKGSFIDLDNKVIVLTLDFLRHITNSINSNPNTLSPHISFIITYLFNKFEGMLKEETDTGTTLRLAMTSITSMRNNNSEVKAITNRLCECLLDQVDCSKNSYIKKLQYEEAFKKAYIQSLQNSLRTEEQRMEDYESRFKESLIKVRNLRYEITYSNHVAQENFEKLENYLNTLIESQILKDYDFEIKENSIKINLHYYFIPIYYFDEDILKSCVESKWRLSNDLIKQELLALVNGERKLWATPCIGHLTINFNSKGLTMHCENLSSNYPIINNGHVSIPCYGTFSTVLQRAASDINIPQLIAYYTQFLESAAPADGAGERAFLMPLITDLEGNITYYHNYDYTNNYKGYNIFTDFDYKNRCWKDREELENANS